MQCASVILKHESPETDDALMLRCFQSLLTFQNVKKKRPGLKNILFTVIKIREIQQIFAAGTAQGLDRTIVTVPNHLKLAAVTR